MPLSPPTPTPDLDRRRRGPEEKKVHEALTGLSQGERLEALRDLPLSRSVKLGGASRIALSARELGVLDDVLDAIRSYRR
jgi:hypothetical protein